MLFEVFGNQSAVAVVRRFLTAKQTSAVQEFARGVFDVPGTHQIEKRALVQWPVSRRRGKKQAEPPAPHPGMNIRKHCGSANATEVACTGIRACDAADKGAGQRPTPHGSKGLVGCSSSFEEFAASRSPARAVANVENPNGGGLDGEVDPVDVRIPALQKLSHGNPGSSQLTHDGAALSGNSRRV